jgi:hypothetical protein
MKKIIVFTMLLLVAAYCFSQQADTLSSHQAGTPGSNTSKLLSKTDYLQKSKQEKKIAWISLGLGAAFITVSEMISKGDNSSTFFTDALKVLGITGIYISVRFFIKAAKHKRGKESNPYPLF